MQCTLRVIYFVGVLFGTWDYAGLIILFSDLPQALYHSAVALTGVVWTRIVSETSQQLGVSTKKEKAYIWLSYGIVITLFMFFVSLNIATGVLESRASTDYTCATTQAEKDKLTSYEATSLTYKAIFALYSILIAILFGIEGTNVVYLFYNHVTTATQMNADTRKAFELLSISFAITAVWEVCGLLIQAAASIYCLVSSMENYSKLALILTAELLPTYALVWIFRPTNPWTKAKSFTKRSKATKTKPSTGPSSNPSSKSTK